MEPAEEAHQHLREQAERAQPVRMDGRVEVQQQVAPEDVAAQQAQQTLEAVRPLVEREDAVARQLAALEHGEARQLTTAGAARTAEILGPRTREHRER